MKRNEAKRANDDSPIDGVRPKVRKYNKSGLPRKISKKSSIAAAKLEGDESLSGVGMKKLGKGTMYSSADDDKSMGFGAGLHGGENADQSQSNMLDTTASSLNNTLTGGQMPGKFLFEN